MRKDGRCHRCNNMAANSSGYCRKCGNEYMTNRYHKNKKRIPAVVDFDGEAWASIRGYEGLYAVSNMGRVRRLQSTVNHRLGKTMVVQEKIMKPIVDKAGYFRVVLTANNSRRAYGVHVLVARAFIPNPMNKDEVNHKYGDKSDNRATELEWMTRAENMEHARLNNLYPNGEKSSMAVLTANQVSDIRQSTLSERQLAKLYSVCRSTINCIKNGKSWRWLRSDPTASEQNQQTKLLTPKSIIDEHF